MNDSQQIANAIAFADLLATQSHMPTAEILSMGLSSFSAEYNGRNRVTESRESINIKRLLGVR